MIDLKSWNPWHGCRKYSEGCANCYMFVLDKAHKVPGSPLRFSAPGILPSPSCAGCGRCGRGKEVKLVDLSEIWTPE